MTDLVSWEIPNQGPRHKRTAPRRKQSAAPLDKSRAPWRVVDPDLTWIPRDFPQLNPWRDLALEYFKTTQKKATRSDLQALSNFLERFLIQENLPTDPGVVLRKGTVLPDFFESACPKSKTGAAWNNFIQRFLDFVLLAQYSTLDLASGERQLCPEYHNPVRLRHVVGPRSGQISLGPSDRLNPNLFWISQSFPHLESWRELALAWFKVIKRTTPEKVESISLFLDQFLLQEGLPTDIEQVLHIDTKLPDFYETSCPPGRNGAIHNNNIRRFLNFVMTERFSIPSPSTGKRIINPNYRNPIQLRQIRGEKCGLIPIWRTSRIDPSLHWISRDFPTLEPWRELALAWFKTLKRPTENTLNAISLFLDRYITQEGLPTDPEVVLRKSTVLPDFFESACARSKGGVSRNNEVRRFLDFVLAERFSILDPVTAKSYLDPNYRNPLKRLGSGTFETIPDRPAGLTRSNDLNLLWMKHRLPALKQWRILASEWIKGPGSENGGISQKLVSLSAFFLRFIHGQGLPVEPTRILDREFLAPSFFCTCCPKSQAGIMYNNHIHDFLDFVLLKECSTQDDYGRPVISPRFHNPVDWVPWKTSRPIRSESNKTPLPYGYICRLRSKLIQGENFRDWTWAQRALGAEIGKSGTSAPDWFPVRADQIDRNDPDCVWRIRKTKGMEVMEIWSPVRWVALAFKLLLPLRTFQVRMLDSGEGDTWSLESGNWVLNTRPLAQGGPGNSRHQGFLHRSVAHDGTTTTQLYANTNKTADIGKSGQGKGYVFPWVVFGDTREDVRYWAEKLRNWQTKYNPISRLTSWMELDGRHLPNAKSEVQLAGYPDAAFLFRSPEELPSERHLPIKEGLLDTCWYYLLESFEEDLACSGETLSNGGRIRFLPSNGNQRRSSNTTNHPLHSLRVSLITALVLDGKVPLEIMQKVVGHSRLLMTLYYIKPGEAHIRLTLEEAAKRLEAYKTASILNWLQNTEYEQLLENVICGDVEGVKIAIPIDPGARNPVGWLVMADGCCLMGGNTSPNEEHKNLGGCYNGGPVISTANGKGNGPVPGGPRNCIRCRWFVTMPHHLSALVARFNNLSYQEFEARVKAQELNLKYDLLRNDEFDAKQAGGPFDRMNELRQSEWLLETAMSRWNDLLDSMMACLNLITRCRSALEKPYDGMTLVPVGGAIEVQTALQEIDSELLQLAQVCDDLEVFPNLEPGKAVIRRSQILDAALQKNGYKPLFLSMTEEDQKLNGNGFLRNLARRAEPSDPMIGRVKVIGLMDAKENLLEHLGISMAECLPASISVEAIEPISPVKFLRGNHDITHKHSS